MNKKGFTFVELMAVVVVLAIIALIAVPNVLKIMKDTNQTKYDRIIKDMENAAETKFYSDKMTLNIGGTICITISQLQASGLIDSDLKNPLTDESFNPNTCIKATKASDNTISFKYTE